MISCFILLFSRSRCLMHYQPMVALFRPAVYAKFGQSASQNREGEQAACSAGNSRHRTSPAAIRLPTKPLAPWRSRRRPSAYRRLPFDDDISLCRTQPLYRGSRFCVGKRQKRAKFLGQSFALRGRLNSPEGKVKPCEPDDNDLFDDSYAVYRPSNRLFDRTLNSKFRTVLKFTLTRSAELTPALRSFWQPQFVLLEWR
jgi:hypothetical protein